MYETTAIPKKLINHIIFNMNLRIMNLKTSFYIYVFPHHLCHIRFHNVDSVDHGWLYFLPQSWQYLLPLGWLPFGTDFVPVSPPQSPCSARETNNLLQVNLFEQNLGWNKMKDKLEIVGKLGWSTSVQRRLAVAKSFRSCLSIYKLIFHHFPDHLLIKGINNFF